jgi:hypothetical protein
MKHIPKRIRNLLLAGVLFGSSGCATIPHTALGPVTGGYDAAINTNIAKGKIRPTPKGLMNIIEDAVSFLGGIVLGAPMGLVNGITKDTQDLKGKDGAYQNSTLLYWRNYPTQMFHPFSMGAWTDPKKQGSIAYELRNPGYEAFIAEQLNASSAENK